MSSTQCPDGIGWYNFTGGGFAITGGVHGNGGMSLLEFEKTYGTKPVMVLRDSLQDRIPHAREGAPNEIKGWCETAPYVWDENDAPPKSLEESDEGA